MSEHMLPDCVFEQKIPLIGCAGTGSNPQHPPLLPASSLSLSLCLSLHTNKRRERWKRQQQPIPTLCHYRTDTLGVKRYDAEHQGELYITLFLFALFHVYFTPSSYHVWLTPPVITTIIHRTSLWNTVIASGYICLSLGKCVKNQKCSPKYVRCHLIISVMIPPFPFLHSHTLWTSAEGTEIIKNRYSKALTQKDFPQSVPLPGSAGQGRVKCPHRELAWLKSKGAILIC